MAEKRIGKSDGRKREADGGEDGTPPHDDTPHARRSDFVLVMQTVEFMRHLALERAFPRAFLPRLSRIEIARQKRRHRHPDKE